MMKKLETYKSVRKYAEASFTEKKSEFIGYANCVQNEEEAKEFVEKIRKMHPDATHNVYAYILKGTGIARFSDDGEPQGTAGMPVLEVIKKEGLCATCIVVTRYFGGILLGAGGLVRAYAKAAKLAIDEAGVCTFLPFDKVSVSLSYSDFEKVSVQLKNFDIIEDSVEYSADVLMYLSVNREHTAAFEETVRNITNAKARFEIFGQRYAPSKN